VAALGGKTKIAARLLGFGVAFYAIGTASREFTEMSTYGRLSADLAKKLPKQQLKALVAEGALWTEERAVEVAISI
jgi:hypothetical protein